MKRYLIFLVLVLFLCAACTFVCMAEDYTQDYDFSELEKFVEENFSSTDMSFGNLVKRLVSDPGGLSIDEFMSDVRKVLWTEVDNNRDKGLQILLLAVCAAVFSNIAGVFRNHQISENSWFVVYLMIASSLTAGFSGCVSVVSGYLDKIVIFMKMLIPAFCLSMVCVVGAAASSIYYQAAFGIIAAVEWILTVFLIPLVRIYFYLTLINQLTGDDTFCGILDLLTVIFDWSLKTLAAVIIGMEVIQGLILPQVSSMGSSIAARLLSAVPGIGNTVRSTAQILIGTGVLVKNAIGTAGCLIIFLISLYPVIRIAVIALTYYGIEAVISPVSDKRITECLKGAARGAGMLLKILAMAVFLFLITLAVICSFTNQIL